jgi:hypothetical protein
MYNRKANELLFLSIAQVLRHDDQGPLITRRKHGRMGGLAAGSLFAGQLAPRHAIRPRRLYYRAQSLNKPPVPRCSAREIRKARRCTAGV